MNTPANQLPIVILSMSRWDGDFSSASWSLAKEFSLTRPVYYVDYPFTIADYIRERHTPQVQKRNDALLRGRFLPMQIPGQCDGLKYITPPLMLPTNWAKPHSLLYKLLSRWNNHRLFRAVRSALKSDGVEEFIFMNSFNPLYAYERPDLKGMRAYIYQSRDNIRALEPYLQRHGTENELTAIRAADISFATSKELVRKLTTFSGHEVQYLPNAADVGLFTRAFELELPIPLDIKHLPKPIIGYTGNICQRMDYALLQKICSEYSDASVVLVGPKNFYAHTEIDLDSIPNLHFTGAKSIEQLPGYLRHFDVVILPFLINELTKSIYPLKINEYLASGKPVVSTAFSEDMETFGDVVYLADNHDTFLKKIQIALEKDDISADKRVERAKSNSWKHRVSIIDSFLNSIVRHS